MTGIEKRVFAILFLSIFSAVTGVGIVIPLLPVYAHDLGASGFYISMIFGSFSISRTVFLPYFGRLSDQNGRKPYIVIGLFAYALVSIGFMFVASVESLIGLRFLHGIASAMIMPVAQAYVGDITPKGEEGFYMGLFNMSMFASLSIGPFMGGVINHTYGLNAAFAGMGALAVVAFLFSYCLLPKNDLGYTSKETKKPESWLKILSNKTILGLFIFRLTYTTCVGVVWCFLPLFGATKFGLNSSQTGTLVMIMVLVGGILHTPMGYVADRVSRPFLTITGGLIITASMAAAGWADGFGFLMVTSVFFGLGGGIALPAVSAMAVIEGKKETALGSVMSLLTIAHSLGMLIGSLIAGLTMDYLELAYAFPVGAALMMAGIMGYLYTFVRRR
jgi:DHA1 family multidrug resistance protein-like MFS transporter